MSEVPYVNEHDKQTADGFVLSHDVDVGGDVWDSSSEPSHITESENVLEPVFKVFELKPLAKHLEGRPADIFDHERLLVLGFRFCKVFAEVTALLAQLVLVNLKRQGLAVDLCHDGVMLLGVVIT